MPTASLRRSTQTFGGRVRRGVTSATVAAFVMASVGLLAQPAGAGSGVWAPPALVVREAGTVINHQVASSANGSVAAATWEYFVSGTNIGQRYVSIYKNHVWSQPHLMTADGHQTSSDSSIAVSPDGKKIVLAWIDRDLTSQLFTPIVSTYVGSRWSTPVAISAPSSDYRGSISFAASNNFSNGIATWLDLGTPNTVQAAPLDGGTWGDTVTLSDASGGAFNPTAKTSADGSVRMVQFEQLVGYDAELRALHYAHGSWSSPESVGSTSSVVGTPSFALSADGKTAVSAWIESTSGGTTVYASIRHAGKWSTASISGDTQFPEQPLAVISGDGKRVAVGFSSIVNGSGTLREREWTPSNWAPIQTILALPRFADLQSLALSNDGRQLMAGFESTDLSGNEDVAVSVQKGSAWTTPSDPTPASDHEASILNAYSGDGAVAFTLWIDYSDSAAQVLFADTRTAAPTLTSVTPAAGKAKGGNKVVLKGFALTGATVTVGGKKAKVVTATSTAMTVIVPSHAPGKVAVTVTTVGGAATKPGAYTYKK